MTSPVKRKRSQSLVPDTGPGKSDAKDDFTWYVRVTFLILFLISLSFNSPICFDMMEEAHVTKCGHTYCFQCITQSLERKKSCPKCSSPVDAVFPNFLLNELITRHRQQLQNRKRESGRGASSSSAIGSLGRQVNEIRELLEQKSDQLAIADLNHLILTLRKKKRCLEQVKPLFVILFSLFFWSATPSSSIISPVTVPDFGLCAERVVKGIPVASATP